ncbi:MAG: type I secretion system permease/ATPase [Candidatus Competibacteraceae bacterium]|nr:type I secretion system permease/ATPase [Candidatus Competibacteraceae bacterium]
MACRSAFIGVGLLSGTVNVLTLTGSFFMLQVYDRVIPSRSLPTLVGLAALTVGLYIFQGILENIRTRVLVRVGTSLDESVGHRVFSIIAQLPLSVQATVDGLQPLRDLDQIRSFLSGLGPTAFFDLPWMPLYLGICFLFHPWIGVAATAGAIILIALTLFTEAMTTAPAKAAAEAAARRNVLTNACRRNAEALKAMGFAHRLQARWDASNTAFLESQRRTSDVANGLGATSKVLRMILQSAILGLGAWLVIRQEASGGIIIASSIMMSRALAPVELAIANWKGFVSARQSWRRLDDLLACLPTRPMPMSLQAPKASLAVEGISVTPPGMRTLVVQDVAFSLRAGQGLGVIGPSASGKSSLVRAVVGVWAPARGAIRLDGAALDQWNPEALGGHIGYLPQEIELFSGTIAENIARFETPYDPKAVLQAAQAAGVHDMILRLPDGYDTEIGEAGMALSAGQKQRVALARALYRDPFLVVLDEPNSNLDADGEAALTVAIQSVRARGGIVIVVAHRPSALASVDQVLAMGNGRVQAFGPKDKVLKQVLQRPQNVPAPMRVAAGSGAEAAS